MWRRTKISRLTARWRTEDRNADNDVLAEVLSEDGLDGIDPFDRIQLAYVVRTCRQSRSLSDAGRTLFAASRRRRKTHNDADRLRKYLARFGLEWDTLQATA